MQTTLPNMSELSTDWATAREQIKADLERLSKAVNAGWATEHASDGTHANITPDAITLQGADVGTWTDLPYAATRFFSSGASVWTVTQANVNYLRATRIGQLVIVMFSLNTTGITVATAASLFIRLPEYHAIPTVGGSPLLLQEWVGGVVDWSDITNGTNGMGDVTALANPSTTAPTTSIELSRLGPVNATFSNWAISANLGMAGMCMFPCELNNIPLPYSF
jgi:hypothetical protein